MLWHIIYLGSIFLTAVSGGWVVGRNAQKHVTKEYDLRMEQLEARLQREREDFRTEGEKFVKDATAAFEKIRWPIEKDET